jgi:hypothetical protein
MPPVQPPSTARAARALAREQRNRPIGLDRSPTPANHVERL